MKDTKAALRWITDILKKLNIPFQITGGFAAKMYGSGRELADIDIDIPEERFDDLLPEVKDYIIFQPSQYKDSNWDLLLMTLSYKDQEIDIAGAYKTKIYDSTSKQWVSYKADLSKAELKEVLGISIPIVRKRELIEYKLKLNRDVDKKDVEVLLNT